MKRDHGFTLIELMVSVAVMGVVISYALGAFTTQNRNYVVTEEVTEAQQNGRAIAELIEREVRVAGFLVPEQAAACGVDNTNAPDVLYVSDSEALDPSGVKTPDLGARVIGGAPPGAGGTVTLTIDPAKNLVLDGAAFYDFTNDGVADTDFRCDTGNCGAPGSVGGGVILIDAANPTRGTACGRITRIASTTSLTAVFDNGLLPKVGGMNAEELRVVPAHRYAVAPDPVTGVPQLLRDGLLLADDVDDLQVAWFFDLNGNGREDAGEYLGAQGAAVYTPQRDQRTLREVRANVVVRTRTQDNNLIDGQFQRTENRVVAVAQDGFRRRVHTATIRLRNVGIRG